MFEYSLSHWVRVMFGRISLIMFLLSDTSRDFERAEKGWTTVERKRRGGAAKRERRAEIVDGRGVTTFWSTPEGLYESWRPYQHRGEASRGSEGFFRGARYFIFLSFCALVGSGAASDRPASAGRGGQERSVSSSP